MDIQKKLTEELGIRSQQTEAVIQLIDEGNTIPFISRYRKEATGGMNDEVLRAFDERLRYLRGLEERKETVRSTIQEQGKLTEELNEKIEAVETLAGLEDLYRPYKPKRRTRAMIAKEKGLDGLAEYLRSKDASQDPRVEAEKYFSEEHEVADADTALALAMDIIAGDLSDDADLRAWIRDITREKAVILTEEKKASEEPLDAGAAKLEERRQVYQMYFEGQRSVKDIPGHQTLAINRGEKEGFLGVKLACPEEEILEYMGKSLGAGENELTAAYLTAACEDAYKRLIAPSIEKEIRGELTEAAQEGALKVFGSNLRQLLMQPPLAGKMVLGWDPAFRTGCKLAVCDTTGKILETAVIYPVEPHNKKTEAAKVLDRLIKKYKIEVISVGNGTASRESEKFISEYIQKSGQDVKYAIVNEAGASVYSASKLATEEYPDLDVGERSSASIARRLQDPLSELVKIDPKSIGVGQYQHDMDQKRLGEVLGGVVETCVNGVGVDLNTASPSLLGYVAGVSKAVASNIVAYRDENGMFTSRTELKKVPKLGPKAYQQCAGFLRIRGGKEALDMTAVHPESYPMAKAMLKALGYTSQDIADGKTQEIRQALAENPAAQEEISKQAEELGVGSYTYQDILAELEKPGRDPRDEVQAPILRSDVLSMEDLVPGMVLKGTVRNIVDFGAFVDIGVHQDGLVHISEMANHRVNHPLDVVKVGDVVEVRILEVDVNRQKIALSMKRELTEEEKRQRAAERKEHYRQQAREARRAEQKKNAGAEGAGKAGGSRRNAGNRKNGESDRRNGNNSRNQGNQNRRDRGNSRGQNRNSGGNSAILEAFRKAEERKKKS